MGNSLDKLGNEESKPFTYEEIYVIAEYLKDKIAIKPKIGIICGSGLGSIGECIKYPMVIQYKDVPKFPLATATGHPGKLIFGVISNTAVMCMQGRIHYFEGYPLWKVVMPVRLMKLMGVTQLIVSNLAGSINKNFKIGDIMIIRDHINLVGMAGQNPLIGENESRFGSCFTPMKNAYDRDIREKVKDMVKTISSLGGIVKEGVYVGVSGPNYETVAEARAFQRLGVDAIGMSTVHEIVTARHCRLICFAFSLIAYNCDLDYDTAVNTTRDEIIAEAERCENTLKTFVENVVRIMETPKNK